LAPPSGRRRGCFGLAFLTFLTDFQRVQIPAKKASGRLSSNANQTGGREPSGIGSFSENDVNGTTQRLSTPSHRRQ
jgi:hypothetical protein